MKNIVTWLHLTALMRLLMYFIPASIFSRGFCTMLRVGLCGCSGPKAFNFTCMGTEAEVLSFYLEPIHPLTYSPSNSFFLYISHLLKKVPKLLSGGKTTFYLPLDKQGTKALFNLYNELHPKQDFSGKAISR